MSRKENNRRQLEEFLRKKNRETTDPFEQDALEGFASLEDEQQALALKDKLDARMQDEVLQNSNNRTLFYWAAAAGLLLFISFSIYLFRDVEVTAPQVVINQVRKPQETRIGPQPAQPNAPVKERAAVPGKLPEKSTLNQQEQMLSASGTEQKTPDAGDKVVQEMEVTDAAAQSPQVTAHAAEAEAGKAEPPIEKEKAEFATAVAADEGKQYSDAKNKAAKKDAMRAESSGAPATGSMDRMEEDLSIRLLKHLRDQKIKNHFEAQIAIEHGNDLQSLIYSDSLSLSHDETGRIRDLIRSYLKTNYPKSNTEELRIHKLHYRP
jgi:hypothetical protein